MELELADFFNGVLASVVALKLYLSTICRRTLGRLVMGRLKGHPERPMARRLTMEPRTVPADWIKSGSPAFKSCEYGVTPDRRSSSGIWSCEGPAVFEWQFGSDESVLILEGRVDVDYLGHHLVLKEGDSALFYAGTSAVWNVQKYVRKSYMVHHPNYIVRWTRRLLGTLRG